tara:strand:- start:420 stop:794 length:375 start_codon:yes stop_codon:yes gene_type:complete
MKNEKVYVLTMISFDEDIIQSDPVGVYSSLSKGMADLIKLEEKLEKADIDDVFYDLQIFKLNESPQMPEYVEEKLNKDEIAMDFMKKGYVDQLIGDDGRFYYRLTEKGNQYKNYIKSFLPIVDN